MYLTFDEYLDMGGLLDEATFLDFEMSSEMEINYYTFNRLTKMKEIPFAVKYCVKKLIDLLQARREAETLGVSLSDNAQAKISSQSNDGVSVSYNTLNASEMIELNKKDFIYTIQRYLDSVKDDKGRKVLYRGVYANE